MNSDALSKINNDSVGTLLYNELIKVLHELGVYEVEIKKTSIHLTHGRAFLGVHPRKNGLLINIVTDQPIEEPGFKTERVSKNRYHNEIVISTTQQLHNNTAWIRKAYSLTN